MQRTIKTIDVTAKEYFDRVNGNSYFAAQIIVNYGLPTQKPTIYIPFQYGYGSQYEYAAAEAIKAMYPRLENPHNFSGLSYLCRENNIVLRASKTEGCKQKEVRAYGEQ